ncbi:MAG: gfo/Idh/MocA family oxidoreductase [Planctomycetaceae bacterium]|nr:MAG: gfo/Idh/MocA family oxidoreductase [Planctomycetaceae bacterium]
MKPSSVAISRRRFVQGTAASVALPLFLPRHVLGDDHNASANEKIRVGAIGIGKMTYGSHLPHFLRTAEVQVVAVCEVDTTRREAGKKRVDDTYGNTSCAAHADYREMLDRDEVDAVVIATPDHWHAGMILDASTAGKDIYCEKPLTNTLREAKLVMDAVKKSGVIFQTGSQQRSDNNFRYACELVRNGRLGEIKQVMVSVGGPPRPCNLPGEDMEPGLDWDRWLGPAPMREYSSVLSPRGIHNHFPSWRNFMEYGGGGMTDWGAHHFDIAQWGLGMDESGPVEIVGPENPKATNGVKFLYANGVEMIHGGPSGVTFIGTEGELFVNRGRLESTPEDIIKQPIGEDQIHLYRSPRGGHGGHCQDWVDCMISRQQPNCPIEVGARTVAVCHLGNIMYLHREELGNASLKWDPVKWEFVGNDAANRWQDYPYARREGYELAIG